MSQTILNNSIYGTYFDLKDFKKCKN